MKKEKIIIDTDPGVDDATALVLAFFDNRLDIKLISTVRGNIPANVATRNVCHLLDLFDIDIPVVQGADKAMFRVSEGAEFLHGNEGLGGYIPPKITKHQPLDIDAVEKIYQNLVENPGEITILVWGPHTNMGILLKKHPDASSLIKQIIFMGGSPYDTPGFPQHDSFNIKTDPEAFDIVLKSGIPLTMIPSNIGRYKAQLHETDVQTLSRLNKTGAFLAKTYETYWEPKMLEQNRKMIATNDACALFYLLYPKMFLAKNADITVDTEDNDGRTFARFCKGGKVAVVFEVNRKKFMKLFFKTIKKIKNINL